MIDNACRQLRIVEQAKAVFGAAIHEVTLFLIGAQARRIGLLEDHHRKTRRRTVQRNHRNLDIAAVEASLDERIMEIGRESCGETGCPTEWITVGTVTLKNKKQKK